MLTIQALNHNFKKSKYPNNSNNNCLFSKEEEKSIWDKFDYQFNQ